MCPDESSERKLEVVCHWYDKVQKFKNFKLLKRTVDALAVRGYEGRSIVAISSVKPLNRRYRRRFPNGETQPSGYLEREANPGN